jgi:hypothetical protein
VNPALDLDLETITLKALRSDKDQRYRSVGALREDLERFQKARRLPPVRLRSAKCWAR